MKTYRIIVEQSSYSKRKGEYRVRHIHARGIATVEMAKEIVMRDFPKAVEGDTYNGALREFRIPGMLYAGRIEIR